MCILCFQDLQLGNNAILGLTRKNLEYLKSVTILDLRDNKLSQIPDEITVLHQLERLDLSNNDLSRYGTRSHRANNHQSVLVLGLLAYKFINSLNYNVSLRFCTTAVILRENLSK